MFQRLLYGLSVALASILVLASCNDSGVSLSSDGRQVAVSHGGNVWVADVDEGQWRKLPAADGRASSPSWSPDGQYVLFQLEPAADQATGENPSAHSVLYDMKSAQYTRLPDHVGPPFAWAEDGRTFVALQTASNTSEIGWFGLDGIQSHGVMLPEKIAGINQIVALPGGGDVAFVGVYYNEEAAHSDVYRTRDREVKPLSASGDIVGIGVDANHNRLLWLRSAADSRQITMALAAQDLETGRIGALQFPRKPAAIQPARGRSGSVDTAVFSPDCERLALIATVAARDAHDAKQERSWLACYTSEIDGSGWSLIRETDPDTGGSLHPTWSRGGNRLAILDSGGGSPRLLIYNADGTGKQLLALPESDGEKQL